MIRQPGNEIDHNINSVRCKVVHSFVTSAFLELPNLYCAFQFVEYKARSKIRRLSKPLIMRSSCSTCVYRVNFFLKYALNNLVKRERAVFQFNGLKFVSFFLWQGLLIKVGVNVTVPLYITNIFKLILLNSHSFFDSYRKGN